MTASLNGKSIKLQADDPLEAESLLHYCASKSSPRSSGLLPDGSRAVILLRSEVHSFCANLTDAPMLESDKRSIIQALQPFIN